MDILWFILVGLIAGWLAGLIMRGHGYGIFGDIILGIIGSVIGGLLFGLIGLSSYGTLGAIVMAVIGAIVLISAVRVLRRA